MSGIRARTACALAVTACALALGACGDDDEGALPRDQGELLLAQLAAIEDAVDNRLCDAARSSAVEFAATVGELPADVDPEVRAALVEASANLADLADDPTQCTPVDTGTTDVAEPTTPTTSSTTTSTTEETTTEEPDEEPENKPDNGPPDTPPGQDDSGDGSSGGIGTDD